MTDITNETIHIAENEETIQNIEKVKRPRGRPKKEKPQREPKKQGRPRFKDPPTEKKAIGRPRIHPEGTVLKPLDVDYFKKYYLNVVKVKINARKLASLASLELPIPNTESSLSVHETESSLSIPETEP